jgi:hypothetical protein
MVRAAECPLSGPKSGHQEISVHYDGKIARECLLLLAGIEFPGFVNTDVGYPRPGNDQWPTVSRVNT